MDLQPEGFILPEGELNESWFPEVDAAFLIEERLKEAQSDDRFDASRHDHLTPTEAEEAREAWVYEQAYLHVYRRKAEDPSSWTVDQEGSQQQTDRQVQRWKDLADEKQDKWTRITERPDPDDNLPGSVSVSTRSGYV